MAITILEEYLILTIFGFGIGVFASWLYMRSRMRKKTIGNIIETAMIEKNVIELEILSNYVTQILSRLTQCNDDLKERIHTIRDVELNTTLVSDLVQNIDDFEPPLDLDIREENK